MINNFHDFLLNIRGDIDIAFQIIEAISKLRTDESFTFDRIIRLSSLPVSGQSSAWNVLEHLEKEGVLVFQQEKWIVIDEEIDCLKWML